MQDEQTTKIMQTLTQLSSDLSNAHRMDTRLVQIVNDLNMTIGKIVRIAAPSFDDQIILSVLHAIRAELDPSGLREEGNELAYACQKPDLTLTNYQLIKQDLLQLKSDKPRLNQDKLVERLALKILEDMRQSNAMKKTK